VSDDGELQGAQDFLPIVAEADAGRVLVEAGGFLGTGEAGEEREFRMISWEERFLAVEDGGIGVGREVDALHRSGGQLDADCLAEFRVGMGEEVGVIEERDGEVGVGEFDDVVGGREAESVPEFGDERGDGGIEGRFRRQVEVAGTG
jgi:hypothetical protein